MKINHFHCFLRKGALQTSRKINTSNRQTLEDVLVIFCRKFVKPESQATAKHKWHHLVSDPKTTKLPDFLQELNQGAEKTLGDNAQRMIDSLLYAKLPTKLKRSVNMAGLENVSYNEIVAHLERDSDFNPIKQFTDCQWQQWHPQHLSPKAFSPMEYSMTPTATIAKKRVIWSRAAKNSKRKRRRCQLKRRHTRSVELAARQTTPRNDVGKVQVQISNLNILGPKTHRIAIQNQEH